MTFFCINDPDYKPHECMMSISLYWAFVYITIFYVSSSIFLLSNSNNLYKHIKHGTTIIDPSGGSVTVSTTPVTINTVSGTSQVTVPNTTYINVLSDKTLSIILYWLGVFNFILMITFLLIVGWIYNSGK